jgi:hypothetical protein
LFGTILAVAVFVLATAQAGNFLQIIPPVQKVVADLVQTQNTLDADHGTLIAWAAVGKLGSAVLAAQKAHRPTVLQ